MKNRDMPAKPCQEFNQGHCNSELYSGLTKLEYAAIQIMAGLMSNSDKDSTHRTCCEDHAFNAVCAANSLFDELEKEQ